MSAENVLVSVDELKVAYPGKRGLLRSEPPKTAVHGVSFEIEYGQTVGLVGESGSGKSTIGRAVLGLLRASGGEIRFAGHHFPPRTRSERLAHYREVQAVFQDPLSSMNPTMQIRTILAEPLVRLRGMADADERTQEIHELLRSVGLPTDVESAYPSELSGGQRQRVAIARALAPQPKLIICDEAVSALDVSTQAQIVNLFAELQKSRGVAYLFIAHDLGVVRHLSHKIGVLHHGHLVEWGDAEEVHDHPREDYTKRLIAAIPVPDPVRQSQRRLERAALEAVAGAGSL
jgi:ABC-type oligopeptide transport system ATPase subunit